jgi:chromate transport protein ChrA
MTTDYSDATDDPTQASLGDVTNAFARIGLLSFGGPAAQIALMHKVVVDEKKWLPEDRFLHALNYCMLLPGPEAMQLATYIGWLLQGVRGGLIAGLLFIVPGFVVLLGLATLYVTLGDVPAVEGILFGLQAAVLAIVLQALVRLSQKTLTSSLAAALRWRPSQLSTCLTCLSRWSSRLPRWLELPFGGVAMARPLRRPLPPTQRAMFPRFVPLLSVWSFGWVRSPAGRGPWVAVAVDAAGFVLFLDGDHHIWRCLRGACLHHTGRGAGFRVAFHCRHGDGIGVG